MTRSVDIERHAGKPGFVQQVGGRRALLDSLLHQGFNPGRIRGLAEVRVERQSQAPQDQESGFIVRVVGAVAVMQPRRAQALLGPQDQLFQLQGRRARSDVQVDARQLLERLELDVLVQLVDAGVDRPELDHLGADLGDEAAVGRAAGGRELGAGGRCGCGSPATPPRRGARAGVRNGLPPQRSSRARSRGRASSARPRARCFSDASLLSVEKRKLKSTVERAGNDVAGAGAGVDVGDCQLVGGKCSLPRSHCVARELGQRRGERGGSGSSPAAGRRCGPARRAPSSVPESEPRRPFLIMSPSALDRGRLADDAVVDASRRAPSAARRRAPCRRPTGLPRRR